MENQEKLTTMQKVDELIDRSKEKGELTYREVIDTLGNDALDIEQMEAVFDRFENADIDVVEDVDMNEIASEDISEIDPKLAAAEGIAIDDPVRMSIKNALQLFGDKNLIQIKIYDGCFYFQLEMKD